ncbi:hypothetical protein PUN71_021655 [Arthrobacter sp. NQ7]|uniref:hypothetical protein n=1 Tax=Arthrobacter sp. NQ7 TaxID=3032303 RepID=UPI002410A09B|nr:hypothetical protein [Arthrobacter sp. NQ7]MDJ0459818.1 hypothetical protein [Arthrobacter sp. NQ7]
MGKRQLFDTVDLTCKAGYRSEVSVSGSGKSPLVLTATPLKSGDSVGDGTLLAEINGSPVFAVTGAFPLYRDLKLKDSGPDARMVNDALVRAGRLLKQPEPSASTVTSYTAAAVAALYTQAGYTAPATGDPVVSASAFQVLPDVGTVSGNVHSTGLLEAEPIATIGVGPRGMICSAANGTVPAEAKSGQQARIAAFGPELRPVTIIAKPVQNPGLAADSGKPAIPSQDLTPSGGAETSALFVEVEEATSKTDKVLPASLILSQSAPEPLVVPSSALWTREGQSLVTVQDDSGFRDVPVVVNFSAGGENAVSAASQESSLTEGDKVVVAGAR